MTLIKAYGVPEQTLQYGLLAGGRMGTDPLCLDAWGQTPYA